MKKLSLIVFFAAVAGTIVSAVIHYEPLFTITKPLILTSLAIHYYFSVSLESRSGLLLLALLFSFIGDVLLIRSDFFIPGLVVFLLAHIVYVFVYRHYRNVQDQSLRGVHGVLMALPIVFAGTGLIAVLYSKLGGLKIPVVFYALVITVMTLAALFRYGRTTKKSFWLVFIGAVLFMISDAILAINKFLLPVDYARVYIICTYSLSQYLIVKGLMRHQPEAWMHRSSEPTDT